MNKPWEDLLYPGNSSELSVGHKAACPEDGNRTSLGGLSQGFRSDFWLRGYKMLGQLTGEISFVQGLFLALTGRLVTWQEDRLLNTMFINNGLTDPRFWLFRTARLAATVKSSPTASLAAGLLVNDGTFLGSGAAYHASQFFYEARSQIRDNRANLTGLVQERLDKDEIIGGYGRVLARGPDERNPVLLKVAKECGLADGQYLAQAFAIEKILQERKNSELYMNSAGLICSLLLDLGMLPHQIMIFFTQIFLIGMSGNIVDAYERPPGEFLALTNDDIEYTGPKRKKMPHRENSQQTVVAVSNGVRIIAMDSVSFLTRENHNDIVICGSHGGLPAAQYVQRFPPRAIVFNDGGRGKDDAGIEGLTLLDNGGIAALAVSVDSARIGDGMDIYANGIVSVANHTASREGVQKGMKITHAAILLAGADQHTAQY